MTGGPDRLTAALADRYTIERELGAGGMATVYLAQDLKHDREVAIKVLRPDLAAVLGADRFLAEIKITARLDHPHILTLIDSGAANGWLYYVLPFVRGESLRDKLNREQQLGLDEALAITRQIAGALDYAHRHGVVHRDIKPENILIQEGEAILADFGIALAVKEAGGNRLTETGLSLGTPQYMSPEQATGDRMLDARSDVYSLGAVLYEMLAGEPPVTGPNAQAMIAKLMTEKPTRLRVVRDTVTGEIDAAVAKALAKTPADRFASAAAFADALVARPTTRVGDAESRRPNRVWLWLGAAGVITVMAVGWSLMRRSPAAAQARAAFVPDLVQLTTDGNARSASLSPDGSRLAFVARDCDERERCTARLVVQDTGGAGSAVLMRGNNIGAPQWTTGGRFLVAALSVDTRVGAYAVPLLGGEPRYLGCCNPSAIGSSDTVLLGPGVGEKIESITWLRLLTVSDGRVHDSIPLGVPGYFHLPLPAPRGGRLVVASQGPAGVMLRLVDRAGQVSDSMKATVVDNELRLWWTPLGDAIVQGQPSGTGSVLVRYQVDGAGRFGAVDTMIHLAANESIRRVNNDGSALLAQWSVKSNVYALDRAAPGRLDFRVRELFSSTGEIDARLSRDGQTIWITRGDGARRRDALAGFDGGMERTFPLRLDSSLVFQDWTSPASTGMIFLRRDGSQRRVMELNIESGVVREYGPLQGGESDVTAVPGGGMFANSVEKHSARVFARPERSDTTWTAPTLGGRLAGFLSVKGDGRSAISAMATQDTLWLYRVPLEGGSPALLAKQGVMSPVLTYFVSLADGSLEYAVPEAATGVGWFRVPAAGGASVRLGGAPIQGNRTTYSGSDDGRRLIVVKRVDRPDVYLVRNFAELLAH